MQRLIEKLPSKRFRRNTKVWEIELERKLFFQLAESIDKVFSGVIYARSGKFRGRRVEIPGRDFLKPVVAGGPSGNEIQRHPIASGLFFQEERMSFQHSHSLVLSVAHGFKPMSWVVELVPQVRFSHVMRTLMHQRIVESQLFLVLPAFRRIQVFGLVAPSALGVPIEAGVEAPVLLVLLGFALWIVPVAWAEAMDVEASSFVDSLGFCRVVPDVGREEIDLRECVVVSDLAEGCLGKQILKATLCLREVWIVVAHTDKVSSEALHGIDVGTDP